MKKITQILGLLLCTAALVRAAAPGIGTEPSNSTNCPGTTATFTVVATGTDPLSYQWYFNETNAIVDATNASVSVVGVTGANAGGYSVIITNAEGSITSAVVQLVVLTATAATPTGNATVCEGATVTLTTIASGTGPFTYVWRKDGGAPLGSTSNQLDIVGAVVADSGVYSVEVTGACNSVTNADTVTVNAATAATGPSGTTTICAGGNATFTTAATGTGLSYVWRKDGGAPLASTSNQLDIAGAVVGDAGVYSVEVSGACGSVTNSATLVVNAATAATGPSSTAVCPGVNATFTVSATGSGTLTYVWRKDGGAPLSSDSNQLDLVSVSAGDAGVYSVEVTGTCGSVTNSATLTVNTVTAATGPSGTTTICAGGSATFTTAATGTGLSYVWRKDGGAPLASTSNQLDIVAAVVGDAGVYSVEVTGACGSVTNSATLVVNAATAATGPSSTAVCPGANATFTVSASGTGPFTYVWRKDGGAPLSSDSNQLDLVSVSAGDAGVYSVEVTGTCGSVTNSATLTVHSVATATGPSPVTICAGQTANFSVTAGGTGPFTYVWRKDGGAPLGSVTSTLSIPSATVGDSGTYSVEVTGTCGSVTNSAALTVNALTTASTLSSAFVCSGTAVVFTTTPGGTGPFTYVWRKNGGAPLASDSNQLDIAAATVADMGTYSVEVSGICNTVTQSTTLTIVQIPVNHALTGVATQSSTYQGQSPASLAIDGNTNGVYGQGSVTHSSASPAIGAQPPTAINDTERAWQVDLGSEKSISRLRVSLRTDCCGERNTNLLYEIRDASYAIVYSRTNIFGANTTAQQIIDLPAPVNGRYVRVKNNGGQLDRALSLAEVEVFSPFGGILTSTQNPVNTTTNELSTVTLGPVNAAVMPACSIPGLKLDYQWQSNGVNITGQTGSNLTFVAAAAQNGLQYRCIMTVRGALATLTGSSVTSSVATLTVLSVPPSITVQPADVITKTAAFADRFSVTAAGTATLGYQWYSNGVAIAGATANTYAASNLTVAGTSSFFVVVSNGSGYATSRVASLTVDAPAGISFDFNTPLQFTNLPYYLTWNNWVNGSFVVPPVALFERSIGGVGPFPGSGSLDMIPNNGTENTSIMLPVNFDFSQPGKTLYASTMFKIKNPTANTRAIQFGFVTATNLGINDVAGQGFTAVILQSTAQPAPTYDLRHQRKNSSGTGGGNLQESILTGTASLVVSNWYKLSITYTNLRTAANSNYAVAAILQDMGPLGTAPGATILSYVTTTNNADIAITNKVYLALRTFENGGIENHDNIYAHTVTGPIYFAAEPTNLTLTQGRRGQFRALVNGTGPYTYQWLRYDGVSTYTNIPGAGSWNHIVPSALTSDNGSQYQVIVTGPANSITSAPVTLTVTSETLALVSAGSVDGSTVGLTFNQPVDPVTAANPANYLINGVAPGEARVHRTSLGAMGPEGVYVLLSPSSVLAGSFTVSVSGVLDLSGGAIGGANSATGTVAGLTGYDVNPMVTGPIGENYSFGPNQYIVTGGGADISGGADGFRFVYKQITGDFDVITRVPYMNSVRFTAKGGIVARPSLDPWSPSICVSFNPGPIAEGSGTLRQFTEGNAKQAWGGGNTGWGANTRLFPPDVWLRVRRVANNFIRYSSTNGVNWVYDGQIQPFQTLPPQPTLYVGLASCAARNFQASSVQFEGVSDFTGYGGAQIIIDTQPAQLTTVYPGQNVNIPNLSARLVTNGVTMPGGELTCVWQRSDGSGGWTNMPTAGATNAVLALGVVWGSDNGAQYRCVLKAPGAADVTSDVVNLSVADIDLPTVTDANSKLAPTFGTYPLSDIVINFSELMGSSALNVANYIVTNAAGVQLTVLSANYLGEDRRTVILKVDGILGLGTNSVAISGVQDLYGNTATNVVRTFRSYNAPTAPVVVEVYQDIGAGGPLGNLIVTNLYTNSQPTWIVFSNQFGFNTVSGFGNSQDNYGVKAYTYFVPPTNGAYKFWIRSDDAMELLMNTNGTAVNPVDAVTTISTPGNPFEAAQFTVDTDPNTKFYTAATAGAGFIVAPGVGSTTVTSLRLRAANDTPDRDPATVTLEGGSSAAGPWTAIVTAAASGMGTDPGRYNWGTVVSFANSTAYTHYRITFPTIRGPGTSGTQISEIELLDASGARVTSPNLQLIAANTGANGNYSVGTVTITARTNITLVAGQRYYMEVRMKEGTGGDGFSVMWTDAASNAAPAVTQLIPLANLDFPVNHDPQVKAISEFYTGYQSTIAGFAEMSGLTAATNFPGQIPSVTTDTPNFNYIAGLPAIVGFQKYFGTQPDLYHTRLDHYLGRTISYFVPPTNGNYKFWLRRDDVAQLYMNTNAVGSTNPAGKVMLGMSTSPFGNNAFQLLASNITLVGGQKYYTEVLWKEGSGGDGFALAVRANGDPNVPPITPKAETIPGSMLELPVGLARVGPVSFGIVPASPVVADGGQLILCANGLSGTMPYGHFMWMKNGQRIFENTITNITPPLTMADNGAVYSLVVSNLYSRVTNSVVLTVLPDTNAPTVVRCVGTGTRNGFTITYSEPVDAVTATALGNYSVSGGLRLLGASLDVTRRSVTFVTSPQAVGTNYTVTITGVRDASSSGTLISPATICTFSTWSIGGNAIMVELFTNLVGSSVAELTATPKFMLNLPDVIYYTNNFGVGLLGGNSNLENYGARITGFFVPTNTGLYRFYIRSDDGAQLWMNINSSDSENPAGKTMLIHQPAANQNVNSREAVSPPVSLNSGQRYYMEGLVKEGTGGDYFQLIFRACDVNGTSVTGSPLDNNATENTGLAFFGGSPGNPDLIQITSFPPTDFTTQELSQVSFTLVANIPAYISAYGARQWQKSDGPGSGNYTNIVGATGTNLTFTCIMADDGFQYRLLVSYPGYSNAYVTTLHVTADTSPPYIVSVGSLNGYDLFVTYNEPVDSGNATDPLSYTIDFNGLDVIGLGSLQADQKTVVFLLNSPITSQTANMPYEIEAYGINNQAASPVGGDSVASGIIEYVSTNNVGVAGLVGIGGYNNLIPTYAIARTNHGIDVSGNGWDIWNAADGFFYVYRQVSGNFDVKTRVQTLNGADQWSKAGFMVRPDLTNNSRMIFACVTPTVSPILAQAPVNAYAAQWRLRDGNAPLNFQTASSNTAPAYPSAWLRLQRIGTVFNAYASTNGTDWFNYWGHDSATNLGGIFPDTFYLGLAVTSHDQTRGLNNNAWAEFRDIDNPVPPPFSSQPGPDLVVTGIHQTVTFSGAVVPGANWYQWRKDGNWLAGETNVDLTILNTAVAHSGTYTLLAGTNGGATISSNCVLMVTNGILTANTDSVTVNQGSITNIPDTFLIGNDTDPELDPLTVTAVSGVYPASFCSSFTNGAAPAGATSYGSANYPATGGAVDNGGYLNLHAGAGSVSGAIVLNELTPYKRVSAFSASFYMKVADWSAEPADGMNFSFGADIPLAVNGGAENGSGTGFSFCYDAYRFAPFAGPGSPANAPGGGTANTSGFKIIFGGTNIIGIQTPQWTNALRWVPVSIDVAESGAVTVMVDGTNVFPGLVLPGWTPRLGRFGIYSRTGGSFESLSIDELCVTARTLDTALGYSTPGATNYGNAYIGGIAGVPNSGFLHLTDNANSQYGSHIINNLTPGYAMETFTASFKLRIGNGTGNAADGFSFNFAGDLPDSAVPVFPLAGASEEGVGSGISLAIDNYPTGGTDSPSLKLRTNGVLVGYTLIPKWNNTNWIPVNITFAAGNLLTVNIDGTNVVTNIPLGYNPIAGRFGFFARTGGENETHWVDDINIGVTTAGPAGSYLQDFNVGGPGTVVLSNGVAIYNPADNACGTDSLYYLVTDGQTGGSVWTNVVITIVPTNGIMPAITLCAPNRNVSLDTNCQFALPDMTGDVHASGNCVTVTQSPVPGTLLGIGAHTVTFTATDSQGNTNACTMTITGIDSTAPSVACPAPIEAGATGPGGAVVTFSVGVLDNCDGSPTVLITPASGSTFPLGTNTVSVVAYDASGNSNTCSFTVTVTDTNPPSITCPLDFMGEATGPAGRIVTYDPPTANDLESGLASVVCTPAAGSMFPLGTNLVTCVATDNAGNTNSCTFWVTIVDTTPPAIDCPTNQVVQCTGTNGPTVTYTGSAVDLVDGAVALVCTPPSGSTFTVGTNVVTCVAVDSRLNTNTCAFQVVVEDPVSPVLQVVQSGTNVVISWPASCTPYVLKRTDDLNSPISWTTVSATVDYADGRYSVTIPATAAARFYRLQYP
jgi:hypothetical protein